MQISKNLLVGIFFFLTSTAFAQTANIKGRVTESNGIPIPGASVKLKHNNAVVVADANGNYAFSKIPLGKHTLIFSGMGFKRVERTFDLNGDQTVSISLEADVQQMEAVEVYGRTKAEEVNRQAFNVTAIDAKKLYNSTLDVSRALDKVAGVRVRETGGVGSNFSFSLNGFSGNRVRFFLDGVPMDNFGSSFQINNIPINLAERIEVYKGVVPMWLGSDALGGAVNIVSGNGQKNYLDASYSFGSFNTHRTVINGGLKLENGLTFQMNAFQNYSDNDYKVKVDAADAYTGAYTANAVVPRFHDQYHNETLIAKVGVTDKSFADKFLFGVTLGQNYKEIQTAARMVVPFGGRHTRGNIVMPSFTYIKKQLAKGLDVVVNANYNLGYEQTIDTVNGRYDWYGNLRQIGTGGESSRTMIKYKNNNGLVTASANYKLSEDHSFAFSNTLNLFNRKGSDELTPLNESNMQPRTTNKNVLGAGYTFNKANKYAVNLFGKFIHQSLIYGDVATRQDQTMDRLGYGLAGTYFFSPNFQVKASYELANRMPEPTELFGDNVNFEGNISLKPEKSNNVNLGVSYSFKVDESNSLAFAANGIYRYADDFIYQRLNQNQSKYVPDNREGVRTWGGDAELRYSYRRWLTAGVTATYQKIQNMQMYEPGYTGISPLYKDQMPNIPYLFSNADVSASFKDVGKKGSSLTIGYNLLYVHEFYLYWPSLGESKLNIPQQFSHDANIVYSMGNGRYNLGLEVRNITNAYLYDNFSLQKPARGFYLNFRYFINKNNN